MPPQISIILINFNGTKFLKQCISSVLSQTHHNYTFTIIDNVSTDQSVPFIRNNYGQNPKVKLIENKTNNGYTGAANQAYELASHQKSKYLMILNPDIVLEPDYLEKALKNLESNPKIAAFTGKILRYDFDKNKKTHSIDSVGIYSFRNRRMVDYGQGQDDRSQFDKPKEIFAVSGSCPIYRLEALKDVSIPTKHGREIFDNDFFMYKEDIDISWRLRLYGWKNYYNPAAVAYHGRGTGILKKYSHWQVFKNRQKSSSLAKYHAYKNQRLMMIKNEQWPNLLRDSLPILWKELLVTAYILFREPRLIKSVFKMIRQIPNAYRKRKHIKKHIKVSPADIRKFITSK